MNWTVVNLKAEAKRRGINNYSTMNKATLLQKLNIKIEKKIKRSPKIIPANMKFSAVVRISGDPNYPDTDIELFLFASPERILDFIFDNVITDEENNKQEVEDNHKLKKQWLDYFSRGKQTFRDRPKIKENPNITTPNDGILIYIEPFSSYDYNFFYIQKIEFDNEGRANIVLSEH
jgi:hypothetical protein